MANLNTLISQLDNVTFSNIAGDALLTQLIREMQTTYDIIGDMPSEVLQQAESIEQARIDNLASTMQKVIFELQKINQAITNAGNQEL